MRILNHCDNHPTARKVMNAEDEFEACEEPFKQIAEQVLLSVENISQFVKKTRECITNFIKVSEP